MSLPAKVESLVKKAHKKPLKFVLFRIPKDMKVSELNGMRIDLSDLKVNSVGGDLEAIPDLHTNPDRASACPLLPDGAELKCGDSFAANIQIIKHTQKQTKTRNESKESLSVSAKTDVATVAVKKEIEKKKSKKVKVQSESD